MTLPAEGTGVFIFLQDEPCRFEPAGASPPWESLKYTRLPHLLPEHLSESAVFELKEAERGNAEAGCG